MELFLKNNFTFAVINITQTAFLHLICYNEFRECIFCLVHFLNVAFWCNVMPKLNILLKGQ